MRRILGCLVVGTCLITTGCGSSDSAGPPQAGSSATAPTPPSDPIAQVAFKFLEAVRGGDSQTAESLLTPLAQQRMRQAQMDLTLLADEGIQFRVGRVEKMSETEASVEAIYMEPNDQGQMQQEKWTLALEQRDGSWRLLGIIAELGPQQAPMVLNFENPGEFYASEAPPASAQPAPSVPQQATRPAVQDPFRQ